MRRPRENRNCPYCLSPIEENEQRIQCPKCGVSHHSECWRTNGKCSVYGCDGWALWNSGIAQRITLDANTPIDVMEPSGLREQAAQPVRCIECGGPVKSDQLVCWGCRRRQGSRLWDNCAGPSLLIVGGIVWGLIAVARALT